MEVNKIIVVVVVAVIHVAVNAVVDVSMLVNINLCYLLYII